MEKQTVQKSRIKNFGSIRRRPVSASQKSLVEIGDLLPGQTLPALITPAVKGLRLVEWMIDNKRFVEHQLRRRAGLLFRGFKIDGIEEFETAVRGVSGKLLEYTYRSTPRTLLSGKVYTSTEYPADQSIPMHNEMSYSRTWPLKIFFFCVQPAEKRGETPIADSRRVFERIDPEIREAFARKNVMYVRNYGGALDLPWQNAFQTESKEEVAEFCRAASIRFRWKDGDGLETRQVCQSLATHPVTGESVWFNQAHLFHVSSLEPQVRRMLLEEYGEQGLPRNAYYGDGSTIEEEVLDTIRSAYEQESIIFRWQQGDLLMLDNMLIAHGRRPFEGPRRIVVGMTESFSVNSSSESEEKAKG